MAGKISDLYVNIGAKTDNFKKGANDVAKEADKLGYSFSSLGKTLTGVFAASAVIAFGKECSQLAMVAEGVGIAFKRIGDESTLSELRKATKGTVNDLDLMKAAVQSNNFGIPLEQLGSLLEFAHQRAKDTGQSVDYLVQSIVMGIGRKSPLILDNLGISAVQLKEKMKGVASETATVGDVAKAVGEIAKDSMSKIGATSETTAEKVAKIGASFDNLKVSIGKAINELLTKFAPAIETIVGKTENFIKGTKKLGQEWGANSLAGVKNAIKEMIKGGATKEDVFNYLGGVYGKYVQMAGDAADKLRELQSVNFITRDRKAVNLAKTETEGLMESARLVKELYSNTADFEKLFQKEVIKTGEDIKATIGIIPSLEAKIKDLKDKIEASTDKEYIFKLSVDKKEAEERLASIQAMLSGQKQKGGERMQPIVKPLSVPKGQPSVGIDQLGAGQTSIDVSQLNNYAPMAEEVIAANEQMSLSFDSLGASIAEGLGGVLAGTENFGDVLINAIAAFMGTLGQQLIKIGIARMGLDKLIMVPGSGPLLIAAGMGLIALAGAARATMSSGVGGSGGSRSASGSNTRGTSSLTVEIAGVVKGSDIYFTQKNYNNRLNATTSRG